MQITIACNPYFAPCTKAHKELVSLIKRYPDDVKLQFRILFPIKKEGDKYTDANRKIFQKAAERLSDEQLAEMLNDWLDLARWNNKWKPVESNVDDLILRHNWWMQESKILYTPTIFLNGRKLPGKYTLDDFLLLIPQLAILTA